MKDVEAENELLKEEIKMLNRKITRLQVEKINLLESNKPASLVEGIKDGISAAIKQYFPRLGAKKLGKAIISVCWSFCSGIARPGLMCKARTYLCGNVYNPQAILSALDLAGGVCNLQAYQVIYNIDLMTKDPYKTEKRNNILLHEWKVRDATKKLHKFCDYFVPMKHYVTPNGKCI